MTEYSSPWRDKYLQALEVQERREKELGGQIKALQRALLQISVAAGGLDYQLDSALSELRRQLRKPSPRLPASIALVEETAERFDSRREQRSQVLLNTFQSLLDQLQQLELPRDVISALKAYRKALKNRVGHLQQYPNLLEELAALQQQALAVTGESSPGFWQRFKGLGPRHDRIEVGPAIDEEQPLSPTTPDIEAPIPEAANSIEDAIAKETGEDVSPVEPVDNDDEGWVIDGDYTELNADATPSLSGETEAIFDRPRHEPAFSQISARITQVLTDLLEQVDPAPCVQQKVDDARQRILRGLNWFELVPTLEDIRDLVLQAYLAADSDFASYLEGVNQELSAIRRELGSAAASCERQQEAGLTLAREVSTEVDTLSRQVASAGDLAQLQVEVNQQIVSIRNAVSEFQAVQNDAETPMTEQLQRLQAQVHKMETQARRDREAFEEQRRRALQDPLTQLPNREAYNDRSHHEWQRWQRYGHPLTLAVCDIDRFKRINDRYGHQAGDKVLKLIAGAISKRLRRVDFMARYGGEEFVILMPETEAQAALKTLDKIRQALANTPFHFKDEPVQVTVSIGVAAFRELDTVESVFARADRALYHCKNEGRDQCQIGETDPEPVDIEPPE